jgi:lycopene beta-cyclase
MAFSLAGIVTRYQPIGKRSNERAGPAEATAIALTRRAAKAQPMTARDCDIAIVGGGLAGGLIALALARLRPGIAVRLFETGPAAGGNHRWSWFDSDLSDEGRSLLDAFGPTRWDHGYDVRFPSFERTLGTPYRSLSSHDFAEGLDRLLPAGTIRTGTEVQLLDRDGVTLASGEHVSARTVIDCRGFAPSPRLAGGWQVFMGRHLRTLAPHGVERPVIMDATVEQLGGYRFVYLLPLTPHEIFVEDTYYQDTPRLDHAALSARLDEYCRASGWQGELVGSETGVLPVVTGGDFAAFQRAQRIDGVAIAGVRGGFAHPLTSYTLPFAAATALAVAASADLPGERMAAMLEERARQHWSATRFYRRLGAMLFGAPPGQRRRVFERFYGLDERLVERFYAGRSTLLDRARVLCGKPPVPLSAVIARQQPLQVAA